MKMRVLAVAVTAALGAHVALAASEGGDTWSEVQPVQGSPKSVLLSAQQVASRESQLGTAFEGSEGGDTWSRFVPQKEARPTGTASLGSQSAL